jgi:hypothetical protein
MSPSITVPDHIAQARLMRSRISYTGPSGRNISPLIGGPEPVVQAQLMRLHALYTGPSRREYVSINWRT